MWKNLVRRVMSVAVICVTAMIVCSVPASAASDTMKITAIDLGKKNTGEALMISDAKGRSLLVDSGDKRTDAIFKWLDRNGYKRRKFDVVVTHWHDDHAGNTAEIIEKYNVGKVYIPSLKCVNLTNTEEDWYYRYEKSYALDTLRAARKRGTKVVYLKKGMTIKAGTVRGKVLYYYGIPKLIKDGKGAGVKYINNLSAVIMFTGGGSKFLAAGDIEEEAEKKILRSGTLLKADIFKLSHHGYNTSNGQAFINAVGASYSYFTSRDVKEDTYLADSVIPAVKRAWKKSNVMSTRYNGTIKYTCKSGKISVSIERNSREMFQKVIDKQTKKSKRVKYVFSKKYPVHITDKMLDTDKYYNRQLNKSGTVFTGSWKKENGKVYLEKNGIRAYNTFAKKNGKIYWFGKNGVRKEKGFVNAYGRRYYMNPYLVTGWKVINGRRYYFMDKRCSKYKEIARGMMMTGFFVVNGKTYYAADANMKGYKPSKRGVVQTGWTTINNRKYYMGENGVIRKGWQTIDGKKYYFSKGGSLTSQ